MDALRVHHFDFTMELARCRAAGLGRRPLGSEVVPVSRSTLRWEPLTAGRPASGLHRLVPAGWTDVVLLELHGDVLGFDR